GGAGEHARQRPFAVAAQDEQPGPTAPRDQLVHGRSRHDEALDLADARALDVSSPGPSGTVCTRCSGAPHADASSAAHSAACRAESEPSTPTTIRLSLRTMSSCRCPSIGSSGCAHLGTPRYGPRS